MNKKIIAILLSIILALALTVSCGKKSTTPTVTTTTPTTSAQTTASKPPTSTSLTGAPTSSTPTTSTTVAPTTRLTTNTTMVISSTPTTSAQPTTSTTTRPTTTTSAPPSSTGESIFDILGRATSVTTVEYDMEITAPGTITPNTSTSHIWMKGAKMRMDTGSGSQKVTILMDNAARTSIVIMGTFGMQQTWTEQDTPAGQAEDIMSYKPELLGDETLDGKLCAVIRYTYAPTGAGTITAKAWIWKQYGFPIKVESTDSAGKKTTMLYRNIKIGEIIDDRIFTDPLIGVIVMSGVPTGIPTGFPGM